MENLKINQIKNKEKIMDDILIIDEIPRKMMVLFL